MATYYIDPTNGNDGDDGLSWANAFLTLNGAEDEPVAAGDIVWVGPGVFRELLTCDISGGNTYSVGTVDLVQGSDQVEGNGTTFGGNVAAGYYFHCRYYDNGADGVTDGTLTFTAAGGNFQASMIGVPIQINTRGAYSIGAVGGAGTLTLVDVNALGNPAAAGGLTYSIMSGEGHHEIESQDDNDTLTLVQPWQGKTVTAVAYLTFNAITYIGDETGENTDGIGGHVRITGSDNDQTAARASCVTSNRAYRVFRGFSIDTASSQLIDDTDTIHTVWEDCSFMHSNGTGYYLDGTSQLCLTIRRCYFSAIRQYAIYFEPSADVVDSGHVIESVVLYGMTSIAIRNNQTGGVAIRNVLAAGCATLTRTLAGLTTGQTVWVTHCILTALSTGLEAGAAGEITEDFNTFFANTTNRNGVEVGANSVLYTPILLPPIFHAGADQLSGFRFPPPLLGELSEWSQIAAIAGVDERNTDLLGNRRPVTAAKNSWGPFQFVDVELESTVVQAGSYGRSLNDAGFKFVRRVPCTNVQTTVTLYLRRETNYAGDLPWMVIKQPGQADRTTIMTAAVDTWEQLSDTFTPAALPGFFEVWVESRNTAAANDYEVLYDTLAVS